MASEKLGTDPTEVPLWNCGDPLRYPIHKEDGDLWDKLLRPLLERDKEQCDAWKDEVENLLIFAGLFSAVVTAFVVESYKGLQPDPNQTIIKLLSQIATDLSNPQNNTSFVGGVPTQSQLLASQSTSPAFSRINAYWFISLVLSLTTVLVGTVGLQWLRAHQRYPVQSTARDKFAVLNMRREGLEEWYVPQIFSTLPVLLQISLVLFLAGLTDFLVLIAPARVFAPVITFIALPILFLISTTVIPSFQWIISPATFFRLWKKVPSQCPYTSPQSSACSDIFISMLSLIANAYDYMISMSARPPFPGTWESRRALWRTKLWRFRNKYSYSSDQIALNYRERCSQERYRRKFLEAVAPLKEQGIWKKLIPDPPGWVDDAPPIHDWLSGLKFAITESDARPDVQAACYHCVHNLITVEQFLIPHRNAWCMYIKNTLLDIHSPGTKLNVSAAGFSPEGLDENHVFEDEISMRIFQNTYRPGFAPLWPQVFATTHEIYIRLMNYYLTSEPIHVPDYSLLINTNHDLKLTVEWHILQYLHEEQPAPPDISEQYTSLLERLLLSPSVTGVSLIAPSSEMVDINTLVVHPQVTSFLQTACFGQSSSEQLHTLRLIETLLRKHFPSDPPPTLSSEYPLVLVVIVAHYVGLIHMGSKLLYEKGKRIFMFSSDVIAAAENLVLPLARCMNLTGIDRLARPPSDVRVFDFSFYSEFVGVCDRRWQAHLTEGTPRLDAEASTRSLIIPHRPGSDIHLNSASLDTSVIIDVHYPLNEFKESNNGPEAELVSTSEISINGEEDGALE